jgi:hypothetical protein
VKIVILRSGSYHRLNALALPYGNLLKKIKKL